MTREERLDWLCRLRSGLVWFDVPPKERPVFEQVLSEVIKALEQEPCEDAVSRKEVLEVFDEWINSREDWNEHPVWFARSLVSLPSVTPTQRWIPVSERLPEKNVEVLVTTEWDCITIGEMFSNNDWFIHEGATNANIDDIKAWMPLPKPYRAEEEKKQC